MILSALLALTTVFSDIQDPGWTNHNRMAGGRQSAIDSKGFIDSVVRKQHDLVSTNGIPLRDGTVGRLGINGDLTVSEVREPQYYVTTNALPTLPLKFVGETTYRSGVPIEYEYAGSNGTVHTWTVATYVSTFDTTFGNSCVSNIMFNTASGLWLAVPGSGGAAVEFPTNDFPAVGVMMGTRSLQAQHFVGGVGWGRMYAWNASPSDWSDIRYGGYTDEYPMVVTTNLYPVYRTRLVRDDELDGRILEFAGGSPRVLAKYLYEVSFDDTYKEDAEWYYRQREGVGGCSAVRSGGKLLRNYDWYLDDSPVFVTRVSHSGTRLASIGVSSVGTNITEDFISTHQPSRYYRCLPGRTLDGINECGVVAEVNVTTTNGVSGWSGNPSGDGIHCLWAVRWVLDNGTSAGMAASNLASRVYMPPAYGNLHYMIADADSTWIVENGVASNVTSVAAKRVMTNFDVLPDTYSGPGEERYSLLIGGGSITNAWYTNAYSRDTEWDSEFNGADEMEAAKSSWETYGKDALRGEGLWQTVHTSVYDFETRSLRIAVQETDDWYVFSLGGVYSVNGKSGTVTLGPSDVGALPVEDAATIDYVDSATGEVMRVTRDLIKPKLPMSCLTNANGVGFVDLKGANTYTPIVTSWDDAIYSYYDSISEVAFGGGVFLLSGGLGLRGVRWSEDGASWTSVTGVAATASMNAFAYGNGIHLAIESPSSNYGVYRSSDGGRTWRKSTGKSTGKFAAVSFANGEFFLSSNDGGLYRSSDGDSWTTISAMNGKVCSRVVYGNGVYVTFTSNGAWRSTDATTWTLSASTGIKRELIFDGGMFLAVGDSSYNGLVRSADGTSWYSVSNLAGNSIAYGGGVYVAALYSGMYGYGLIYSNDGTTWQSATGPDEDAMFYKIVYSDGVFVAVGPGIWYSTNGASWTKVSYPTPSAYLATAGNHRFIVAEKGHGVAYKSRLNVVNGSVKVVQGVTVNGSVLAPDSNNVVNITISESDPTVPAWAKEENPPTESDPTVPAWAKGENPPTETDPTVPDWAKQPNPPQGMDYEAMTNTVNETKSRYFDSGLGVEWTFVPMNGEFMFIATTNVNREVIE